MTVAALTLIVADDERPARRFLTALLKECAGIEVVGEASSGEEAITLIQTRRPQLALLDLQMPEIGGLEVVRRLAPEILPLVAFVTAFDDHAIEAFELNAIDYLLKPFDRERFHAAVERARARQGSGNQEELAQRLSAVLAELQRGRGYAERVLVKADGRVRFVAVEDLHWVEAADNYVRLHARGQQHLVRETIRSFETRLDPARFARIHRSAIINLSRIGNCSRRSTANTRSFSPRGPS